MAEKRKSINELLEESRRERSSTANSGQTSRKSINDLLLEAHAPSALEELNAKLQKYAADSSSFSNTYNSRYFDKDGNYKYQYRGDSSDWLSIASKAWAQSTASANEIRGYLDRYKSFLPEDSYNEIVGMLSDNSKMYNDIYSSAKADREHWSQWDSEDAYKASVAYAEDYEKKRAYNLDEGTAKIKSLETEIEELKREQANYKVGEISSQEIKLDTQYATEEEAMDAARLQKEQQVRNSFNTAIQDLEKQIQAEKLYMNQAKRIQEAYKLASVSDSTSENYDPDFEYYAQMGEAIENPSFDDALYDAKIFGFEIGGEEVLNKVKFAKENLDEYENRATEYGNKEYFGINPIYAEVNEEEYKVYNYYLAKDIENGKKGEKTNLADEYLKSIEGQLEHRRGTRQSELTNSKDMVYQTLFTVAASAAVNIENIGNYFSSEDYISPSPTQVALQGVGEDMASKGTVAKAVYDTSSVVGNMLPSVLVGTLIGGVAGAVGGTAGAVISTVGQVAGASMTGLSAAGAGYQEMLNLGYDKGQARAYGTLVGASEATLQYALGGISALGGKATSGITTKMLSTVDNVYARFAIKYGSSVLSEITEEEIQLYIEPFLQYAILNVDYEAPDAEEMLYTALVTALSTGILEGPSSVSSEVGTYKEGKTIKEDGKVDRLVDLGKTYSVDTVAYQLANRVDENTGAYTIGRLLNEVNASFSEQNLTDIKNALIAKGVTEAQAETLAKWMNHVVEGGNLTKKQQVALEANDVLGEVLYGTIIQQNSTVMQRGTLRNQLYDIAMSMGVDRNALKKSQSNEVLGQRATQRMEEQAKADKEAREETEGKAEAMRRSVNHVTQLSKADLANIKDFADAAKTVIPESNYYDTSRDDSQDNTNEPSAARIADTTDKVSDTGATELKSTGEEVSIKGVASIDRKTKTMMLELSDGRIVDSKDINYGNNEQAALYESALEMGYDPHTANLIVQGYTPNSNISVEDYLLGTNEAVHYGWGHINEKGRTGSSYAKLTQSQKELAVKLGEDARAADDKAREARVAQKQSQVTKMASKGKYGARLVVDKGVTDRVKASVKVLDAVAKALKINIIVDDLGGNAYGYYKASTNELIIDVNAGGNGKHTLLFTASHELVHYIRDWSPSKFTVLADFLMEQYIAKGENIDALIEAEKKKALRATRGKHQMTYDEAYEEVVAQAMQSFLTDSNFVERLAVLQKKDANLAKRLVSKLKEILQNVRDAYKGIDPDGRASETVKEMGEVIDDLYAKMEEALISASEASQTIGARNFEEFSEAKNTDGKELFQYKAMEADEETYRQMLKKHGIMSDAEINKLFSTIDKAMVIIKNNLEILDYAWDVDIDDRAYSPVKPNSDNLYKVSLDFSTLCRKRILQQVIQTQLQDALKKPLSREESIAIRDELMKIQEEGRQIEIACALCYVESARMKSPAQIKKFLKDRENVIKEFLASKSGGDIKQKIAKAEAEARERLGVGNATLKSMPEKAAKQIRLAKKEAKKAYTPTAEEQKLIDAAKSMSVSDFTSPEGLANLAKNYPVLFDAYTSYVRNATKSKGIEKDTWWRAGDSGSIGDTLIANMNRENGLRSQSWSDFQVIHMLDYIAATIELSTRNAKEQAYSKVPDYIELMGNTGVMLNMSLIPTAKFNGKLEYDSVEGMAYKKALELREKYHATAGTICIGISDEQIKMLLDDSRIDYVIPYHKSGMAAHIRKLMHIPTWSEYEKYQNETNLSRDEALKQAKKYGVKLLSESDENYHKHTAFSEWFDLEEARKIAEQENAFPSDAKLQKKLGKMYGGYMAMQNAANNYLKLCAERGIAPKFSHENANFTTEANYWKLIIDRKMVDNVTGDIIEQQAIKPIFDEAEVLRILNDELERYPNVKADQDYATRTVVEKFLSGKMNDRLDADTVAAIMQKPVDNITTTNIIASQDDVKAQYADEDSVQDTSFGDKTGTDTIVRMNALVATSHNTPLTDSDLDAYLKVGVKKKTRDKKHKLLEDGKKPILTSKDEVADFMDKVVKNEARNEVRAFAIVGKRLADEVKAIRRDVNVLGRYIELNANLLKESYDNHIKPKEPGDIELTKEDFENIPQLLDEFDAVMSINVYNKKVEIHLAKKSPNGYIKILTLLSNERGSLQVIKLVGNSNNKFEKKYPIKKGKITGSHVSQTEISEGENPDTPDMHTAGDSSDTIIQDEKQNVKTNLKIITSTLNMQDEMVEVDASTATAEYADIVNTEDLKAQYIDTDETYSYIGKEVLGYNEGNRKPDLTLVEMVNERTGLTETTIKFYGEKPKNYVPKKIAYCYKLFEQHPDGTLHALFAGASNATPIGEWVYSQGFPYTDSGVKGMNLRERYGWHLSAGLPSAPHLMSSKEFERGYPSKNSYGHPKGSKRVWVRMAYDATTDFNSVADSTRKGDIFGLIPFGGYYAFKENNQSEWVISSAVKIDKILTEDERQQVLKEAGYDEYEAWRKKHRATEAEKAEAKRKSAENKKAKDMAAKAGLNYLSESSKAMREAIQSRIIDNPELDGIKHQYIDTDSDGNKLSEGQQEFFKDSKVRDKNGNLMVVYHGTPNKFFTFRQGVAEGWGKGIYFTDNKAETAEFGDNVIKAYLNIKNPFNADTMSYYDIGAEDTKAYRDYDMYKWKQWWSDDYDSYEEYREDGMGVDLYEIYTEEVSVFNQILRELGYDGIIAYKSNNINGFEIVAFDESQPKLTSNKNPTTDPDIRYQYKGEESIDNRDLLAKALEGAAKTDVEKQKLKEYKSKVALINAEEKKLRELRAQIKEISFSKGPRDTKKLKSLQFEANQAANRINTYDKQLLRLEATKPLMDVVQREKELVRKKMDQQRKKAIAEVKEKNAATIREIMNRNTESRKKAIERRDMSQIRNKIKAFKAKLESNLLTPTDRGYVPFGLAQAMIDVCSLIDTDTDLYKKDGNINKSQVQRNLTKDKLQALKDEYEKLKDYDDPVYSGEFDEAIYLMLKDLRNNYEGRNLKELSLDELRDMYDLLRSIGDTLADARNLIGKGESTDVYETGDAIISEQREVAQKRKKDKRSGVQKAKDGVINLSLSPVRNVERMSGYKEGSALVDLFNDFEIGERQKKFFKMESFKSFEALTKGKNAKAYESAVYDAFGGKEYMDDHGRKFSISKMQMMQAILSQDREKANNMNHIRGGGLVFADLELLRKGNLKEAISSENSHLVSNAEGVVEQFRQELADDKWAQDYMAAARAFFDGKAKDAINNTMLTLKHRIVAKDKNYIPFEVDKNFVVREISAANDIQQTINSYGMLQETKDKAPQPLIMTGLNNIVDRHIDQVASVVGLAIPVRNFNKVWNVHSVDGVNTTVNNAIEKNWGAEGKKFIEQVVQDVQGPRHNTQSELYRKVKSGYIGATFLLNGSVVAKQIGSMFAATSMLRMRNPASMMANLVYTMANYKKIAAEVDKYTATAWERRQGMSDAEVYTLLTEGKKHPITKALNKMPAILNPTKWITAMDSSVALSLWRYAKQDVKKAHPELSGEDLNRATASFYDTLIENTQSMTDVLHRPEIQKRSDIMSEAFGMFKTDLYQMSGQLQNAVGRFEANKSTENAKYLGRTVYSIAASAMWGTLMTTVFALLRYKVNPYRDDEDDELTVESWLKRFCFDIGGDLMGYAFPLFGSEVMGTIENIVYGESEDIADSLALTAINDLYSTTVTIASSLKEGEAPTADDYKKLLTKSLQVFGIPANNILRTIDAARLHAKDIANGEFLSFEAGRKKSNGQKLYEAILRGNEEQIEELKLEFDDEEAINNALVKAIRENNVDVVETASKFINGNYGAYESMVASLVKQGFDEDVAVRAIRSVITMVNSAAQLKADGDTEDYDKKVDNLLDLGYDIDQLEKDIAVVGKTPSDATSDADEAESIYKASDINTALENGDVTTALKVIDDLVQVKTENYISEGYKKSEAKKKAEASVKSSVTSYWKPLYLQAKANKDLAEVTRIKKILKATKLYDNVTETTDDWWVAYKKTK